MEDFFKFCALLKKSELYKKAPREIFSYGTVHKLCRLGKGGGGGLGKVVAQKTIYYIDLT